MMTTNTKPLLAFRVDTKELLHTLNLASHIIEKRSLVAILGHIKLDLANQQLSITATDKYLLLKQQIKVQEKVAGSIAVDLQILTSIVRKIPTPFVDIEAYAETNQLLVTTQNCCFKLNTLASNQFPQDPTSEKPELEFTIKPKQLSDLILYTQFSASDTETRYNLSGICLHKNQAGELTAVALDGHRLSLMNTAVEGLTEEFNIIIPRKAAQEIIRIFQGENLTSDLATIRLNNNQLQLMYKDLLLSSKLIAAKFPNYSTIIPQDFKMQLTVEAQYFAQVIDRVTTVIIEKLKLVQLKISQDAMEVLAYGEGKGEAVETISATNNPNAMYYYNGSPIEICFNPKYLIDIFTVIKEGKLTIKFNNNDSTVVFMAETASTALFAIMPIKSTHA